MIRLCRFWFSGTPKLNKILRRVNVRATRFSFIFRVITCIIVHLIYVYIRCSGIPHRPGGSHHGALPAFIYRSAPQEAYTAVLLSSTKYSEELMSELEDFHLYFV